MANATPGLLFPMPFDLSPYDHVALDMNGTFLFGYDRFGPDEDFGATYRRLGYERLDSDRAHGYVRDAYDHLAARYVDPAYYDRFPSVAAAIAAISERPLDDELVAELVETFSEHEFGELPRRHAAAIERLRGARPLSVVSNLWAPKRRWVAALADWGIAPHLGTLTFSSDGPHIKPHPALFHGHLAALGLQPGRVLYVGDSHRCDVAGAYAAGLDAVWLTANPRQLAPGEPAPVAIFDNLCTFAAACVHSRPV